LRYKQLPQSNITRCDDNDDDEAGRRAKMTTELMEFGTVAPPPHCNGATNKPNQTECYRLTQYGLKANPTPDFTDLSQDMSVTLLFSSSGYGPHLIAQYEDVAQVCQACWQLHFGSYVLLLTFFFYFRHEISQPTWPIAVKLCSMIGSWLHFIIYILKCGWPSKNGGQ